jgi:hypothetical protein
MFHTLRTTCVLAGLGLGTAALAQAPASPPPAAKDAAALAYANATTAPSKSWKGPVFQLSHNYPQKAPAPCAPTVCKWLAKDIGVSFDETPGSPTTQWSPAWNTYMQNILDYIREGQNEQLDNTVGWQVNVNGTTRWFHVPWMAYDPTRGREFVHGLTNERTAVLSDFLGTDLVVKKGSNALPLSATQSTSKGFETWAFGVYNEYGGYAIGRSWGTDGKPQTAMMNGVAQPAGLPFPEGTLVAKILFTTATPKDVPYLEGSPAWQADRHIEKDNQFLCQRAVQEVRMVQLDIAVVDSRSPTRWVFGTFAYNGKLKGKTFWERLAPVGVQWGNDPWSFPAVPKVGSLPIVQSVLNTKIGIPQHFGCNGRLAGPVDNKLSSCMACHANGYTPQAGLIAGPNTTPNIFGFPGQCTTHSPDNANYFTNNQFPMSYTGGQYENLMNMDTSLQMQVAFLQYGQFAQAGQPVACKDNIGN